MTYRYAEDDINNKFYVVLKPTPSSVPTGHLASNKVSGSPYTDKVEIWQPLGIIKAYEVYFRNQAGSSLEASARTTSLLRILWGPSILYPACNDKTMLVRFLDQ